MTKTKDDWHSDAMAEGLSPVSTLLHQWTGVFQKRVRIERFGHAYFTRLWTFSHDCSATVPDNLR